ncbi:MAG: hypothetical protein ABSH05_17665 [Bryobacteraceae bacterium]|jgi:hypothetical protein
MRLSSGIAVLLAACVSARGLPPRNTPASGEPQKWVIEATGVETAVPDVFHVMMKMEYEAGRAADATSRGEKRLREFLDAAEALKVPGLTWRVANNVLTESNSGYTPGIVYTRNIVFTAAGMEPAERDRLIAKLEDLGARYNSHCVTCIGSG